MASYLFTAQPHPAASEQQQRARRLHGRRNGAKQGWEDVTLRRYDVLHSSPRNVSLEMMAPRHFQASLREDRTTSIRIPAIPPLPDRTFGYSASGDVTAELVYAHSGNPEDYELLRKNGISVKGKIVIVRYSNPYSYRGFKALTAEREGAAALLIYSDPAEDGYTRGKVFPDGPWGPRATCSVVRSPTTTSFPAIRPRPAGPRSRVQSAFRPEEARSLPKILALPLSWRDAKPLLENMNGPEVPAPWRGALPITYRFTGRR